MKHLYTYTLTIPLRYYTYDLRSDEQEGEFILGLTDAIEWDEPLLIEMTHPLKKDEMFTATENIHFCLSSHFTENRSDDGTRSFFMPDRIFNCTVSGIVAVSKKKARKLVEGYILRTCKSLSVLMSCNNCNKQGYQPRVEADYEQQEWKHEIYQPYEKLMKEANEPKEYIDENGRRVVAISMEHGIMFSDMKVQMTIFGNVDTTHFFDFYNCEQSPNLEFMVDEYYTALGTESMTSKFFHLFSIIENVEKNYVYLADTHKIFDEDDKGVVLRSIEQLEMPKAKLDTLRSTIMGIMGRATEIGREAKLVNILHNMGIKDCSDCGTPFIIDKDSIRQLTNLRNSYYHGDGKKCGDSEKYISVDTAVARLMNICERIIVSVMKMNRNEDDIKLI